MNGYFAFFATITVKIILGIQWILQKVYSVVNKNYLSLSRQMEFHADSVAAYVTGSDHLVTSLRRLEVADTAYNKVFDYYNQWFKQNLRPENVYPQHTELMLQYAIDYDIPLRNGLPHVTASSFSRFNKTRVVVKDQWASHPSTDDREQHLNKLNIRTEAMNLSAWTIFREPEQLQRALTDKLFNTVQYEKTPQVLDNLSFRERCLPEIEKFRFDKRYKGFFNGRDICQTDLRNLQDAAQTGDNLDLILDDETVGLPYEIEGLKSDIATLNMIADKSVAVKTFEFNGKRYKKRQAAELVTALNEELRQKQARLEKADHRILAFFLKSAAKSGRMEDLRRDYSELFQLTASAAANMNIYCQMMEDINPIYYGELEFSQIHQIMEKVKLNEVLVKDRFKVLLADESNRKLLSDEERAKVEEYLSKERTYFRQPSFDNEALALFQECMGLFNFLVNERVFVKKKNILDSQLKYIG
jgi:hypothetical protein